jgi:hypothetical protein
VTGFSFTISGAKVPPTLTVSLKLVGSNAFYCKVVGAGAGSVRGSDLRADCTSATPGGGLTPGATFEAVQWHISGMPTTVQFDFCISNLALLSN